MTAKFELCRDVRENSVASLVDKYILPSRAQEAEEEAEEVEVDGKKKKKKGPDAVELQSVFDCLVPLKDSGALLPAGDGKVDEKARVDSDHARCDLFAGVLDHFAEPYARSPDAFRETPLDIWFGKVQPRLRVRLDKGHLRTLWHACKTEAAGGLDKAGEQDKVAEGKMPAGENFNIHLAISPQIPADVRGRSSFDVAFECDIGVVTKEGKGKLSPGETTTFRVARALTDQHSGLACELVQGKDGDIRTYEVKEKKHSCSLNSLMFKKLGKEPLVLIPGAEGQHCPFHWQKAPGYKENEPSFELALKDNVGVVKAGGSCDELAGLTKNDAYTHLLVILRSVEDRYEKLRHFLLCMAPYREVGQAPAALETAKCELFVDTINHFAAKQLGKIASADASKDDEAKPSGKKASAGLAAAADKAPTGRESGIDVFERIARDSFDVDVKDMGRKMWNACTRPPVKGAQLASKVALNRKAASTALRVTIDGNVPLDVNQERAFKIDVKCTAGAVATKSGGTAQTVAIGGSKVWTLKPDLARTLGGIDCHSVEVQKSYNQAGVVPCTLAPFSIKKLGTETEVITVPEAAEACPYAWQIADDSAKGRPHVRLVMDK